MTISISRPDRLLPDSFSRPDGSKTMKAARQTHPEKHDEVSNQRDWKLWRPQRHRAIFGGAAVLVGVWIISLMTLIVFRSLANPLGS